MKKNPSYSFKWVTILFNYKDYQITCRNGMWSPVEEIWVNDELKLRRHSWKWRTQNSVELSNGETLNFDFGNEKIKEKSFLFNGPGLSLYVKSGDNEIFRVDPEKIEFMSDKLLLASILSGIFLSVFVLPLIWG